MTKMLSTLTVLGFVLTACAPHSVLECDLKGVDVVYPDGSTAEHYRGPCKPVPEGTYP